jgi:hypothetical protein
MRFRGALLVPLAAVACATSLPHAEGPRPASLHPSAVSLPLDPTVRDLRFVPLAQREDKTFGSDPGGGVRSIEDGVRVVSLPGGAVLTSDDRLPMAMDTPLVTVLPERLGGGFLFVVDATHIWRADGWLSAARPFFTSRSTLLDAYGRVSGGVVAGLDRVYVFTGSALRSWQAVDGATGREMPLGPWPASPSISAYAAVDGWRAIAIADLRGVVATFDAGATWRAIQLPIDARDVSTNGDAFDVRGADAAGNDVHYEVRADGQTARAADARTVATPSDAPAPRDPTGPLGANALAAAVEDGWPAGDGTAIVARDGALARVRLDDGSVAEIAPGAYDLRPSRCHPIALGAPGGIGFACGEPRGATILYAFDPTRGRMTEVRRFDSPRAILASGNGAVAVRGPCDPAASGDAVGHAHHYCVRSREGAWREIRLEGDVGGERVVVLDDGRVVIVSPPEGNLAAARLTILEGERARGMPLVVAPLPKLSVEIQRVLDAGVWLDGFEERRPGVVGGWIEASGTMLGVEIDLEGQMRFGQYVRDAGRTMVSGRYGLGWTPSLLGLETTNGGMTWTPIDVPAPIATGRAVASRACGPVGCSAAGWLKIGWGGAPYHPTDEIGPSHAVSARRSAIALTLACDTVSDRVRGASRDPFAPFPTPPTTSDETLVANEGPNARVYAWGPKAGDWDHVAKWSVRWVWPFGGPDGARSTIASPVPSLVANVARIGALRTLKWSTFEGDDASHALLATHRKHDEMSLFELEADHAPIEIERADGEAFAEIDAAVRAGGRWYLATPPRPGERTEATVWQVEGSVAHELARVPRTNDKAHAGLAWRSDGKAIGFVVTGAPSYWPTRWVLPIDLESGSLGDIEPLGAQDFGDRPSLPACTSDDAGWSLDIPAFFPIRIASANGADASPSLGTPLARVRISGARACVERVAGLLDALPTDHAAEHATPTSASSTSAPSPSHASLSATLSANAGHERRQLRCTER